MVVWWRLRGLLTRLLVARRCRLTVREQSQQQLDEMDEELKEVQRENIRLQGVAGSAQKLKDDNGA